MRVFLSWSGVRSLAHAAALRDWLPLVLNSVEPWLSNADLDPGRRWEMLLSERLQDTDVGLVLFTRENLESQWLLFESGALAKSGDKARVIPICIDVEKKDLPAPLSMFQGVDFNKNGMYDVVRSLASFSNLRLSATQLKTIVDQWWPNLESVIGQSLSGLAVAKAADVNTNTRTDREILEEVLFLARASREPTKKEIIAALKKWEDRLRATAARAFEEWDKQDAPTAAVADRLEDLADTLQSVQETIGAIANHAP